MPQIGFFFDQTRCTGCHTCSVSCKDWHDVPAGPARLMRILKTEEGRFPDLFVSYTIAPCYHCADPVCLAICPNDAISKREKDGIVVVEREKCRGQQPCGLIPDAANGLSFGDQQSPCQVSCPVHLGIPAYVALIASGRFNQALELVRRKMPLPSVCGRICMHPCEAVCRRREVEDPVAIMALKRFLTDNASGQLPNRLPRTQKDNVAIVGSGPAGLAAAYDLIRRGYGVTVFEADPVAGGMLATGISEYRLPKAVLARDIEYIQALGVEIRTGSPIDLTTGVGDLLDRQDFEAVLLALGACKGQTLDVPGAELGEVMTGTAFMRAINLGDRPKLGSRVLVIGGGNVAVDCARSARRLGSAEVQMAFLESAETMPADTSEVSQALEEGIALHPGLSLVRINGVAGAVAAADFVRIEGLRFTEDRPDFRIIEGSQFTLNADSIIFAVGQRPETAGLNACGIGCTSGGAIRVDSETMLTDRKGVFAAGDSVTGPTDVVNAIASGQKAAIYIDRYLQGDVLRFRRKRTIRDDDIQVTIPPGIPRQPRRNPPLPPADQRVLTWQEVAPGLGEEAAIAEAKRCLNCAGHLCKDVCPYSSPQFADEEKAKIQKCDLCVERLEQGRQTICAEACPLYAIDVGPLEELKKKHAGYATGDTFGISEGINPSVIIKGKYRRS